MAEIVLALRCRFPWWSRPYMAAVTAWALIRLRLGVAVDTDAIAERVGAVIARHAKIEAVSV